jgi:peptidoglycan/LPS O-acetylase OafA/YrhL
MAIAAIPPKFRWWPLESVGVAIFMVAGGIVGLILGDLAFGEIRSARVFMYGIPAAAIVYGATRLERSGYVVRGPLLLSIGAASYSLYLIHPIFLSKVERLLDIFPPPDFLLAFAVYLCAVIGAVVLALLSYTFFERPTQHFLKRVLSAWPADGAIKPVRGS